MSDDFHVAFLPSLKLQRFGNNGDFSYGMYLYAFPIQQLLVYHFSSLRSPVILTALALPLTFIAAFISWHLVEKPFLFLNTKTTSSHAGPANGRQLPTVASATNGLLDNQHQGGPDI